MENTTCKCGCAATTVEKTQQPSSKPNVWHGIASAGLGVLYALFPKCPLCWAAWMSIFGSFGWAKIPYQPWLSPLLAVMLVAHLVLLWRNISKKGMAPFVFSMAGVAVLVAVRYWSLSDTFMYFGMAFLMVGSFLTVRPITFKWAFRERKDWQMSQSH